MSQNNNTHSFGRFSFLNLKFISGIKKQNGFSLLGFSASGFYDSHIYLRPRLLLVYEIIPWVDASLVSAIEHQKKIQLAFLVSIQL